MRIRIGIVCAVAMVASVLGFSSPVRADSLTVKILQGKVRGKTIKGGKVKAFLGLPYAAPPVGDLRWRAPEPPAKWKGVRDATARILDRTTLASVNTQVARTRRRAVSRRRKAS